MTDQDSGFDLRLSRRKLLAAAGLAGGAALAPFTEAASAETPAVGPQPTPPVTGMHLQFGADASSQMSVSWHSLQPVSRPRVLIGHMDGRLEQAAEAKTVTYTDAKSGQTVYAHHAAITDLRADTQYLYAALHDGVAPRFASFRTAPRGRAPFTFTSFGDQGTPSLGRLYEPPAGVTLPGPLWVNDNLGTPAAGDTTLGVERLQPLFHLFNGDLCYANLAHDRVRAWWDFWDNNGRSAQNRPWMPSPGNHENELGNGPIGYRAYQTFFQVPQAAGQTELTQGLWYAFTAGSVRVIALANDDICYQDSGDSYVHGYSNGAQKAWLEAELAAARRDAAIDWIVVCMHQVAISTADHSNGADLGIREEWVPLFDKYGVDLVVCGHEHHYERSHPIRGQQPTQTLTPIPADTDLRAIDTTKGTVHMVIGGGGTSKPSNGLFFDPPQCRVIVSVTAPDDKGRRHPVYVNEPAAWSATRNAAHAYGFAAFDVDPGPERGGHTTIKVTYYDVTGPGGEITPFESFTLRRPRRG
jgi:hypothetical protein